MTNAESLRLFGTRVFGIESMNFMIRLDPPNSIHVASWLRAVPHRYLSTVAVQIKEVWTPHVGRSKYSSETLRRIVHALHRALTRHLERDEKPSMLWDEVDTWFPEASVKWDFEGGSFNPILLSWNSSLVAIDPNCLHEMSFTFKCCSCMLWSGEQWGLLTTRIVNTFEID